MNGKKLISWGGGVNSTAMIISELKKEKYNPAIVFADTGNERPETYAYIRLFKKYLERNWDKTIYTLTPRTHREYYSARIRNNPINTIEEYSLFFNVVPFVRGRWCTSEFKRDAIRRWGKARGIFTHLIGIHAGESGRVKESYGKYKTEYPLFEDGIDQRDCEEIIKGEGLPIPIKSGCFFCPYQKLSEWKRLYKKYPHLFQRAIALEKNASDYLGRKVTYRTDGFSTQKMKEIWKMENPLFPEMVDDYSQYSCYMCRI